MSAGREDLLRPRMRERWTREFKRKIARAIHHAVVSREDFMVAHAMSEEELNAIIRDYGPEGRAA